MTDPAHRGTQVAIALGSNLGDRVAQLTAAAARLTAVIAELTVSSFHDTAPVGVSDPQPNYLNAAAVGYTHQPPRALLQTLLDVEHALGRLRPRPLAARTIDLDLILYGSVIVDEPGLTVPHPRFRDRLFVLVPLAEVAPAMIDPVTGLSVGALLQAVQARQ